MLEIIVAIMLIVLIVKVADRDGQSTLLWGAVTFVAAAACIALIPLPFLRLGIAGLIVFAAMIGYKTAFNK